MVYIVGGLPGAGKSTYSEKLADQVGGIVFSTDAWMTDLFWMDKGLEQDVQWALDRTQRCEKRMIATSAQLMARKIPSILDIGFVNLVYRKKTYKRLDDLNLEYEIHFIDVDKETRWKRVQRRNRDKGKTFSFEVTREMFDFMEDHFDKITNDETIRDVINITN